MYVYVVSDRGKLVLFFSLGDGQIGVIKVTEFNGIILSPGLDSEICYKHTHYISHVA